LAIEPETWRLWILILRFVETRNPIFPSRSFFESFFFGC
jgi:hypothetical protein